MIPDFNFAFSSGIYFLFGIVLIIAAALSLFCYRQRSLQAFVSSETLRQQIMLPRSPLHFLFQVLCLCLAWFFAVIALMGPQGNGHYIDSGHRPIREGDIANIRAEPVREIIFFLDTSASMSVKDTHQGTTRIDNAKEIIDTVLNDLGNNTVALYAFTSEVTPLVPLTFDYFFAQLMLKHATINEGDVAGTDLLKVMEFIKNQFIDYHETPIQRTIILLSDGGDTQMESLVGKQKGLRQEAIVQAIQNATKNGVTIYTIGVGSLQGGEVPFIFQDGKPVVSAVEEKLLEKIAEVGGGGYYFADHYTTLLLGNELTKKMHVEQGKDQSKGGKGSSSTILPSPQLDVVYDSYYQFPLALAILFLACAVLIPDVRRGEANG